jgi:transmembrane sensor
MTTSHFNNLLQRYLNRTASGDERNEFFRLIRSGEHDQDLDSGFLDMLQTELRKPAGPAEKIMLERIFNEMLGAEAPVKTLERRTTSVSRHWWMTAAAVVLMTVVAWVWMIRERVQADRMVITGPEYVTLPDGSTALLNEGGTLTYSKASYGRDFREVTLTGEAYFDIRHNSSAAFLVHTGNITTTVLGTAFNVNALSDKEQVVVTVARGKVKVGDDYSTFSQITPGERIVVNTASSNYEKTDVDPQEALEWVNKYLILDRVSVAEAADIIAKKYNVKVTVSSEALKNCTISAKFLKGERLSQVLDVVSIPLKATYTIRNGTVSIDGDGRNCALKDQE